MDMLHIGWQYQPGSNHNDETAPSEHGPSRDGLLGSAAIFIPGQA